MAVNGFSWKCIPFACAAILVSVAAVSNAQDFSLLVEDGDKVVSEKQEPTPAPLSAAAKKKTPPKPLVLELDRPAVFSISDLAPTPADESTPPLFPPQGPKAKFALKPPRASDSDTEDNEGGFPEDQDTPQEIPAQPEPIQEIPTPKESSPEPSSVSSEKPQTDFSNADSELIQERYPNGKIKIARYIVQDNEGNFINHGAWKMLDQNGALIAEGVYQNGKRTGLWNRWHRGGEANLFSRSPYSQFKGPFLSQATFEDGQLNGKWTIFDSKQNIISEVDFKAGLRHDKAIWRRSGGAKMREADYSQGVINGKLLEWNAEKKQITNFTYQEGRRLASKTVHFDNNRKKTEGVYLHAKIVTKSSDDWWNARFAVYALEGKDEKHGSWTAWHANGQKLQEGEYHHDSPVGQFTWWYSNGQKALEGFYNNGKQQGGWSWWHTNGLKKTQGEYKEGNPANAWVWWKSDGKVAQRADFSQDSNVVVKPKSSKQARHPKSILK